MKKEVFLHAIFIFLFSGIAIPSFSQNMKDGNELEMKTYYLVFLKKGQHRDQDSLTAQKIQEQHLAHISKMAEDGVMSLAGPFMENGDIRGICVYNTATPEEAEKFANMDPAVKAGRLKIEVHPWYSAKGACLK